MGILSLTEAQRKKGPGRPAFDSPLHWRSGV